MFKLLTVPNILVTTHALLTSFPTDGDTPYKIITEK